MNILIVEDDITISHDYSEITKDFMNSKSLNHNIISVKSFEELKFNLLTQRIDCAIVDYNFDNWQEINKFGRKVNGRVVCDFLAKFNHFSDLNSQICLYSAKSDLSERVPYKWMYKMPHNNLIEHINREILSPMINVSEVGYVSTMDYFHTLSHPEKYSYLKYIISTSNINKRFCELGESNLLWTSNLLDNNKLIQGGYLSDDFSLDHFKALNEKINNCDLLPNIFWNFSDEKLFKEQDRLCSVSKLNPIAELFYNTTYSYNMAEYIFKCDDISKFLDILKFKGPYYNTKDIQFELIYKLVNEKSNQSEIKKILEVFNAQLDCEVIDVFYGTLDFYNEKTDFAQVTLNSVLNLKTPFKQEFSYKRLKKAGVIFKETNFKYCISSFQGNLEVSIEPEKI
ncbi:MAG: hypothetical protein MUF43_12040 [Flavobacterium sp.]|jgi:hypothetical protein|nr:hypothetical protein [Flavobacterium sp.]